ncbi:MAG: enoyl-CoA hydratase-related protein [Paludibacteraceae bacterium]|nr:enoyl-CoA hydratase-related protein [Paludibacteraceae bacterium]MCQ2343852.1 enoyl-CoA hydratase-related protein [Paludibacteraceae bacterium]
MEYNFLKIADEGAVRIMTISAPKSLNALNRTILEEIDHCVSNIPENVRVLVITGDGEKSFVAGADISQMAGFNEEEGTRFGEYGASVFRKIEDLPIPVIAAINGFALGGGCEIAMACDIRIAADNAVFGQPEVKLGIIPGFSGTYRLAKLVGQGMAKDLIYTGRNIKADEALRIGLVNAVLPHDEMMAYVMKTASMIVANAPKAVAFAKRAINENYDMNRAEGLALENRYFGACFATEDQKEGMNAFLNKRKAEFQNK